MKSGEPMGVWRELGEEVLQLIYPENLYCMGCGDFLDNEATVSEWGLCGRCMEKLFSQEQLKKTMEKGCEGKNYQRVLSCTTYGGLSKEIIGKFKNDSQPWLGKNMGRLMAERFREEYFRDEVRGTEAWNTQATCAEAIGSEFSHGESSRGAKALWCVDFVTFVPVHERKKRLRGYDQAQILAKQVAACLGVPCLDCLLRTRMTAAMKNMSKEQRRFNVEGAFAWKESMDCNGEKISDLRGKRILLIDDVVTTGSTAEACARVLCGQGATEVILLTFAAAVQGS